jgi:hypothetical protein
MGGLWTTILISAVVVLLAVAGLAIGIILTGKSKLNVRRCGWDPHKKRDESCGKKIKCPLCQSEKNDDA